jgi:hypothetical protein
LNATDLLRSLAGTAYRNGCPVCDATQRLVEVDPGVFVLQVGHDLTCPTWREIRRRRGQVAG